MPRPIPKHLTQEERDNLVREAQKNYKYAICGYVSLATDGRILVCKKRAGAGTSHKGVGKCWKHGGRGRPITTGAGVVYKPDVEMKTLLQKAKDFHLKQVKDHIESVRLAKVIVDDLAGKSSLDVMQIELLRRVLDTKLRAESLQLKAQESEAFSFDRVINLVAQILEIIDREVTDVATKRRLLQEIKDKVTVFERK